MPIPIVEEVYLIIVSIRRKCVNVNHNEAVRLVFALSALELQQPPSLYAISVPNKC